MKSKMKDLGNISSTLQSSEPQKRQSVRRGIRVGKNSVSYGNIKDYSWYIPNEWDSFIGNDPYIRPSTRVDYDGWSGDDEIGLMDEVRIEEFQKGVHRNDSFFHVDVIDESDCDDTQDEEDDDFNFDDECENAFDSQEYDEEMTECNIFVESLWLSSADCF